MDKENLIRPTEMCEKHQSLLVHGAGYKESDSWRVLLIVAQLALFQAATADKRTYEKIDNDIRKISTLGCLACYKPDAFGEIVKAAKSKDVRKIKKLGEKWIGVK